MLSNKWTFSLKVFVILLTLCCAASTATAGVLGENFKTTITLANPAASDIAADGMIVGDNQFAFGTGPAAPLLKVVFDKRVNLLENAAPAPADPVIPATGFAPEDVKVMTFNKMTGATATLTLDTVANGSITRDPATVTANPWAMFTVAIPDIVQVTPAADFTVVVTIAKGAAENADPADVITAGTGTDTLGKNDKGSLQFDIIAAAEATDPKTVSVMGLPPIVLSPDADPTFTFTVTLSEKPKEFKKDHIDASNATVSGDPVFAGTVHDGTTDTTPGPSTENSNLLYRYLVTIAPKYESKDDIVIKIKSFEDVSGNKSPVSMAYMVKVNSDANKKVALSGAKKYLPEKVVVPADGYLVVSKDKGMSLVVDPGNAEHGAANRARRDRAFKVSYNLIALDLGVNLEGFLTRGGTIDLVSPQAGLAISEVMWATDGGSRDRQWIEISNMTSSDIKFAKEKSALMLYEAGEALPDMSVAANNIQDRVSTLYQGANYWSIAGKGQSGRIDPIIREEIAGDDDDDADIDIEVVDTAKLVSMQRAMDADGYADGTMSGSWSMSVPPARNLADGAQGLVVATPGTAPITPVTIEVPAVEAMVPAAMASDIMITEIMVDTDSGRLPQWIELTSSATGEVSLDGWELRIDNAIDADVLGGGNIITVDLSGVTLDVSAHTGNMGKGQSALVVAWAARDVSSNIRADRVVNVATQLNQTRQYQLLSYKGFKITLAPPQMGGVFAPGDKAGNLHEGWELPMSEAGRSSLIRREMNAAGATLGTDANGWTLADSTSLITGQVSFYGNDEDAGTPGQDAGGPLPVELSHFRPARDKETGAVVITWSTQSELNNAGFFIKRAQQRDGQFKVINATMVPGAGTTSEKQFYTFTDTTAQPNVVYYYQIEDVSLDGNRQTLTNGIRLKGHIGAAGKLTTSWGELKEVK